jgi:uncharacterized protein (DUF58 family)
MTMGADDDRCWRVDADDLIALRPRAERLRPAPVRQARSTLVGGHRSRMRGRGMDYRESRHYQAGDDIRNMDWRITARAGDPHVKVFDEERERPVVVLGDFGPSMFFASRGAFKSVVAARLAALIGWTAIHHGDRIGALLFNGEHQELSPTGGRRGQMRLIRALVKAGDPRVGLDGTARPGALSQALGRLRRVARPGSLVCILTDFYGIDDDTGRHLAQLGRHNDLIGFQILDPLEQAPPPPGRYGISDGRRRGLIDTGSSRDRRRWEAHFAARQATVDALVRDNPIRLERCITDDDPALRLADVLAARGRPAVSPSAVSTAKPGAAGLS